MKIIQKVSLSIVDSNVNPRQLFAGLIRRNYFGKMLLNYLIKSTIAEKTIRFNVNLRVHLILNELVDGLRFKVWHYSHFKEITPRVLPMILWVLNMFRLRH